MATEFQNIVSDYSDPKKKVLYYLKVMQQARLQELAKSMKISKMAVHKHLAQLQKRGLVESIEIREGVGRPKMQYRLTSKSKTIFPKSYGALAVCALDFIEKNMGKEGVEKVLRERQVELFDKYYERLKKLNFDQKVRELAKIRDEEGYIAESKKEKRRNGLHTLLEYNCPILEIAENHWEACSTETELFEKLLGAKIETTHRAAKGDTVCKFIIKEKKEEYL
ncbi:MAG: helix-turn-helix transcriptional regulator [Nitrososphaeraceae archaeon]